jgi:hypothetical protein
MNKIIFFLICLFIFPSISFSEEIEQLSCSAYFEQNKIKVTFDSDFISYDSGDPVMLKGSVTNNTKISLTNASVHAKVLKSADTGYIIMDEFVFFEDLDLKPAETKNISFNYLLPLNYGSGEYKIIFFVSDKEHDISGVLFTNDFASASTNFTIESGSPEYVRVSNEGIKINDEIFNISDYFAILPNTENLKIDIPVLNISEDTQDVKVTYSVYKNSFVSERNKVFSGQQRVEIDSKEEKNISFSIDNLKQPTYLIVVQTELVNQKDVSVFKSVTSNYIHFFTTNNASSKISLTGFYPQESKYLVCAEVLDSKNEPFAGTIETIVSDTNGSEITRSKKEIQFRGFDNAVLFDFDKKKVSTDTTVTTNLYNKEGTLIDSVSKTYTCEDVKGSCTTGFSFDFKKIALILGSIVIVIALIVFLKKKINIELV